MGWISSEAGNYVEWMFYGEDWDWSIWLKIECLTEIGSRRCNGSSECVWWSRVWKWERIGEAVDLRLFRKRMWVKSMIQRGLGLYCVCALSCFWVHFCECIFVCACSAWECSCGCTWSCVFVYIFKIFLSFIYSFANPSPCSLSHRDNYPKPQVDSYVCQSAAFSFSLSLLKERSP